MIYAGIDRDPLWLEHHGILGQKHGVRNGPPYPLGSGPGSERSAKEKRLNASKKAKSEKPLSVIERIKFDRTMAEVIGDLEVNRDRITPEKYGDFYKGFKEFSDNYKPHYDTIMKTLHDPPSIESAIDATVAMNNMYRLYEKHSFNIAGYTAMTVNPKNAKAGLVHAVGLYNGHINESMKYWQTEVGRHCGVRF